MKKMDQPMWRSRARSPTKNTLRSLGAVLGVLWTFSIHSAYLLKNQSENKKLSWSVWMSNNCISRIRRGAMGRGRLKVSKRGENRKMGYFHAIKLIKITYFIFNKKILVLCKGFYHNFSTKKTSASPRPYQRALPHGLPTTFRPP